MGRFFSRMFCHHVLKSKLRLQQCSRSPSSSFQCPASFQWKGRGHSHHPLTCPQALSGTEIHDVMLHCVSIFVKKNVSQNRMEKCITSLRLPSVRQPLAPPTPSPPLSVGDLQCSETERAAESPIGQKIKVRGARLGFLEVTRWCDLHNLAGARKYTQRYHFLF